MAGVDQRLCLQDQYGTGLARLGAAAWTEIGKPDVAALRHLGRARSRRTRHLPACFPYGLCATRAPSALRAREPRPRDSSALRRGECTRRAGFLARGRIDHWLRAASRADSAILIP